MVLCYGGKRHRSLKEGHRFLLLTLICFSPSGEPMLSPCSPSAASGCYLTYTSGSTGQPKGVLVPHTAVIHVLHPRHGLPFIPHPSSPLGPTSAPKPLCMHKRRRAAEAFEAYKQARDILDEIFQLLSFPIHSRPVIERSTHRGSVSSSGYLSGNVLGDTAGERLIVMHAALMGRFRLACKRKNKNPAQGAITAFFLVI